MFGDVDPKLFGTLSFIILLQKSRKRGGSVTFIEKPSITVGLVLLGVMIIPNANAEFL